MTLPSELKKILKDLQKQEWIKVLSEYAEIYIVGGSVRDAFTGKPIKDVDLIVDGLSLDGIQKRLQSFGKINLVGESFSVIKFRPNGHIGEDFDIAVPREDRKVGEGHKGFEIVTDGVDIMGDLKRRDFTINSMAVNVLTEEFLDPFNGIGSSGYEAVMIDRKYVGIELKESYYIQSVGNLKSSERMQKQEQVCI